MKQYKPIILILASVLLCSCKISYTFSGTSIAEDVNTITVKQVDNKAMRINPLLALNLTQALIDQYRRQTRLEVERDGGDLEVEAIVTSYELTSLAVTANETASQNRLTITVKLKFTNNKYPKENFEKSFAAFKDYPSTSSFDSVEQELVEAIIKQLTDDIFLGTVARW